ncbi:MAG: ABC transporter permease subunit [Rhodospirillaceae bacterium]|nr:ABC transporter permease subunit [Rhodospirillaceae bacterium]
MSSKPQSGLRARLTGRLLAEGLVVFGLFAWWLTAQQLPDTVFPSPVNVFTELGSLAASGEFWSAAGITGLRVLVAVVSAIVIGTALGLAPRYVPWTQGIVDDVLVPLFTSFPAVAWAIIGSVWFGVTPTAIIVVQTLIILPFCLVNVSEGAKDLGQEEVEMGRSFGRRPLAIFWHIELPMISPFVVAGARIAYGVCWKVSLIAELFGARSGLGFQMSVAQDLGRVDTILAICLAIVAFVVIGDALVLRPLSHRLDAISGAAASADARPGGRAARPRQEAA